MSWLSRTRSLHGEFAAIADDDPRWWLLAGGAAIAEVWPPRPGYVVSDAEPATDTFIGYRVPPPVDPLRDAIERARAARAALRELHGTLPEQPLAVTIERKEGARAMPSALDAAAFAIGPHVLIAELDDPGLPDQLAAVARGVAPPVWLGAVPFVCVSVGDDPIEVARHGHRRGWRNGRGPWLGLGHAGELATVSTSHMVVDGFGHGCVAGRIHALTAEAYARQRIAPAPLQLPTLAAVADATPLGIAWREASGASVRALPLAYAVGQVLHRAALRPGAAFSPTLQIPVAPGQRDDPERRRRRAQPAAVSVRFTAGVPEPYEAFEGRARAVLAREAEGKGLCGRLIAATRAIPTPLAWKRAGFSTARPPWLDRISDVLGGRAFVSRIKIDTPIPPSCAASAPSRYASPTDPLGACVITVIDDGQRAAVTVSGSGVAGGTERAARDMLDELLALTAEATRRAAAL